jgi:hypothetical protein
MADECMVTGCPNPATRHIDSKFPGWPGRVALCGGHGSRPEPTRKLVPLTVAEPEEG